ncbi:MAG: plasmid stabilization protein [Pseudomonadota bacterium]
MANLTLRNIDESLKASLRVSAAESGRSMEEEARQILKQFLLRKRCSVSIGSCISKRFSVTTYRNEKV